MDHSDLNNSYTEFCFLMYRLLCWLGPNCSMLDVRTSSNARFWRPPPPRLHTFDRGRPPSTAIERRWRRSTAVERANTGVAIRIIFLNPSTPFTTWWLLDVFVFRQRFVDLDPRRRRSDGQQSVPVAQTEWRLERTGIIAMRRLSDPVTSYCAERE